MPRSYTLVIANIISRSDIHDPILGAGLYLMAKADTSYQGWDFYCKSPYYLNYIVNKTFDNHKIL